MARQVGLVKAWGAAQWATPLPEAWVPNFVGNFSEQALLSKPLMHREWKNMTPKTFQSDQQVGGVSWCIPEVPELGRLR
jgi:hypothetical protein